MCGFAPRGDLRSDVLSEVRTRVVHGPLPTRSRGPKRLTVEFYTRRTGASPSGSFARFIGTLRVHAGLGSGSPVAQRQPDCRVHGNRHPEDEKRRLR